MLWCVPANKQLVLAVISAYLFFNQSSEIYLRQAWPQAGIMLARLCSASLRGLDAEHVDVEVDLSQGLPCWTLVYHINQTFSEAICE